MNVRNNFFSHKSKQIDEELRPILNSSIDSTTIIRPQSLHLVQKLMEVYMMPTMSLITSDFSYLPDLKVPGMDEGMRQAMRISISLLLRWRIKLHTKNIQKDTPQVAFTSVGTFADQLLWLERDWLRTLGLDVLEHL
ncbi:unnamed protein product [Eruca vesicaria subsp. sativa]|uniref:Uncharacterized protein n=1 Tax=Eruca vesicaria subsp. sativa TaxID=29727 RepID=A0ABC8INI3_ERUVS|nr:unnamed protein product [Eruca vesicaria subsp. sativa]